ncbi:MAG: hypothetical protein ACM3OF_10340, partial [Gemmatimonas sp.]
RARFEDFLSTPACRNFADSEFRILRVVCASRFDTRVDSGATKPNLEVLGSRAARPERGRA